MTLYLSTFVLHSYLLGLLSLLLYSNLRFIYKEDNLQLGVLWWAIFYFGIFSSLYSFPNARIFLYAKWEN